MRLLLIEDYGPLRKAVCQGFRQAGFAVDVASEGTEGHWLASTGEYDVIVLDLMLPGMDGREILRRLRAAGDRTHILVLTAKDTLEDRVQGLDLGADDYLVKPFAFEELLARVRALVRRRYDRKDPVLRIGRLAVDTRRRTVRVDGESVDLTPREYALLEFLALRAGEVVTREEIWEHVYDFHSSARSNVVDVYVGYLRKKLDTGRTGKLIHTRRGHGYVLGGEE